MKSIFLAALFASNLSYAGDYLCVAANGQSFPYLSECNDAQINVSWYNGTPYVCSLREANRGPTVRGKLLSTYRDACTRSSRRFSVELDQGGRCDCTMGMLLCP